jgi:hypothetical protein
MHRGLVFVVKYNENTRLRVRSTVYNRQILPPACPGSSQAPQQEMPGAAKRQAQFQIIAFLPCRRTARDRQVKELAYPSYSHLSHRAVIRGARRPISGLPDIGMINAQAG